MFRFAATQRRYSSSQAFDQWMSSSNKQRVLSDAFHSEHLSDLYITLPTRDGTRKPYQPPIDSSPLGYGHHLAFFHERVPESQLREDGTEDTFSPPKPFTRRMWAGGRMTWNNDNPLIIGQKATAASTFATVEKKGFDDSSKTPMVFVNQKIDYIMEGGKDPSVVEERAHVYLSSNADVSKGARAVTDVPASADFYFQYTPSLTTLFRFSALTFNAHHIHLDQDYSQRLQGYPERLVHGPLTALMLLETAIFQNPGLQLTSFEYRARNPLVVKRTMTIRGSWTDKKIMKLWCVDENGVVGMTGMVETA